MKKVSTVVAKPSKKMSQQKLTVGLDLGDRNSWYCVLDESGQIQLEQRWGKHESRAGQMPLTKVLTISRAGWPLPHRWRFPNELPIAGEPADVYSTIEKAHRALAQSSYPPAGKKACRNRDFQHTRLITTINPRHLEQHTDLSVK
jgi:hypothetical protein